MRRRKKGPLFLLYSSFPGDQGTREKDCCCSDHNIVLVPGLSVFRRASEGETDKGKKKGVGDFTALSAPMFVDSGMNKFRL